MNIKESLELLTKQINLSLDRDDRADLYGAYGAIEEALRTLKGLQELMEIYRKNLGKTIDDLESLYAPDPDESWWNK